MNLNKSDLVRLLGLLEGELQARDFVISRLKVRHCPRTQVGFDELYFCVKVAGLCSNEKAHGHMLLLHVTHHYKELVPEGPICIFGKNEHVSFIFL